MNFARATYTQTVSGNKNFTVPFPYLSRDHVHVTVGGSPASFTWLNPNTVSLSVAPALGAVIDIRRSTSPDELLVQFTDGSVISETDLSLLSKQSFYLVQESGDLARESNGLANDAVAAADAATETANSASAASATAVSTANAATATANAASAAATNAVNTANNALSTANAASTAATNAVNTANSASTAASNAVSTANTANAKADAATVTANSAASTANTAANNAATAVSTANTALSNADSAVSLANFASIQADAAQSAAVQAAANATSAANDAAIAVQTAAGLEVTVNQVLVDVQAIANGDLADFAKNSENLSGLTNKPLARQNIGLGNVDNTSDLNKPISTATQAALDGKAPTVHGHTAAEITGLESVLVNKADVVHTHPISDVVGLQAALDGKAAASHAHAIANVTGLQTALDGKAAASHTHPWSQVTDKPTTFPPSGHSHAISEVTGLQAALDGKLGTAGGTATGNLRAPSMRAAKGVPSAGDASTTGFAFAGDGDTGLFAANGSETGGTTEMWMHFDGALTHAFLSDGRLWTSNYGWLNDHFFRQVGNCASGPGTTGVGSRVQFAGHIGVNCYGSGTAVGGVRHELIDNGGTISLRTVNFLANCNCDCQCDCGGG